METFDLIVTGTGPSDLEETCYSASVKVPLKAELLDLLPSHMDRLVHGIQCHTGPLSGVKHSIVICLYRECNNPKLTVFVSVEKKPDKIIYVKMITATIVLTNERAHPSFYSLTRSTPPKNLPMEPALQKWYEGDETFRNDFWELEERWHDDVSMVSLMLHVVARNPPRIINETEDKFLKGVRLDSYSYLDVSEFFMSKYLSDFTLICNEIEFPAHRIVLSSRVNHFKSMFNSDMKEVHEGVIRMDDINPSVCKELLRFVYQGKVENLCEHVNELYAVSDKYGMDDLKGICEQWLYNHVDVETALEIFDLSQMHRSPLLATRAKEIILSNKSGFAPDAETFKRFTCKYPDLVFQLFQM